jgi:4-hydroxymandelate oxidase
VSLDDYEALARERLDAHAWAYIAGGAADEWTLAWNREAFDRLKLQGRVLADFAHAHTRLSLLGETLDYPVLLAPVAFQKLAHPEGERLTIQAASAAGALAVVSTESSCPLEDLARLADGPLWFQLYIQHDRAFTLDLVRRAESAGYRALMVTVDAPVSGIRNQQQRLGTPWPADIEAVNLRGASQPVTGPGSILDSPLFRGRLASAATWKDIEWLGTHTRLPILLKGITSADDAERAMGFGVQGIVVSNHGGRTLDTLPAAIDLLPRVAKRVDRRIPLLLDGGIRRGTDVLKALALGASAVMIGRPYIYALAVAGAPGIAHVLHIIRAELETAMALTGCATLADIMRNVIWTEE